MNDLTQTGLALARSLDGDTPTLRLFGLLEIIAAEDRGISMQGLVERTGLPKPTMHRMLQQLETAAILQRASDGRRWLAASRLRRLAENVLLNDTLHGARHRILTQLVDEIGETCNITALSGSEVIYLDRVETAEPLRISLHPGSRVPVHCSASGKLLIAQLSPSQRRRLIAASPLARHTDNTITDVDAMLAELMRAHDAGHAYDNEEFLPGLFCLAVLVPSAQRRSNLCVAVQAPVLRLNHTKAQTLLPALHTAAAALARLDADDMDTQDAADKALPEID